MTDTEVLAWLDANTDRLEDVYWHIQNEGGTVREAVEFFAADSED